MECPVICNPGLGTGHSSTVTVSDQTIFIDGTCNNALLLTDDPGYLDVDDPTGEPYLFSDKTLGARAQVITSVSDALIHFSADSEVVNFTRAIFENQNNGLASYFYIGYWDKAGGETVVDALDRIEECQPCWLPFTVVKKDMQGVDIVDTPYIDLISAWAISNDKFFTVASHSTDLANPVDSNNVKARLNANGYKTTAVEYIPAKCRVVEDVNNPGSFVTEDWHPYREGMLPLYQAKVDFEAAGSPYTWAYKPTSSAWVGIPLDTIDGGVKTAVTGVFPSGQANAANNGYANVYVKDYGNPGEWPGKTVTGAWIDDQHLLLYMKRRIRQAIANVMAANRTIPFDNARGRALLFNTLADLMTTMYNAGWFSKDAGAYVSIAEDEVNGYNRTGPGGAGWGIKAESFQDVTAERRSSRVAPPFSVCFITASAVHVVPITLCATADPSPTFGTN